MKIAIYNRDPALARLIHSIIMRYSKAMTEIRLYNRIDLLYKDVLVNNYDMIFLDVDMTNLDGFKAAGNLKRICPKANLIFISSHENLVFQSFEYEPLWFVRKTNMKNDVKRALNKYWRNTEQQRQIICFKTGVNVKKVLAREVYYLEVYKHTVTVKTVKETFSIYGSLKEQADRLEQYDFVRTYRNFLVNIRNVELIEKTFVKLINQEEIPLSKDYRPIVREKFLGLEK